MSFYIKYGVILALLVNLSWCASWHKHAAAVRSLHMSTSPGVVIVGGGFGGLYTALKLSKSSPGTRVTLVDPKDKFVFLPLLYELAVGSASIVEVAPRYEDLLRGTGIRFVQGSVTAVDATEQTVSVQPIAGKADSTENLAFEQLVLACGAQPNLAVVPGASQHAIPFC